MFYFNTDYCLHVLPWEADKDTYPPTNADFYKNH